MPRFVILDHDHPWPHWDFMLEWGNHLRTWRLRERPALGVEITAESLGDHRIDYLEYEGPLTGGRGRVVRWDAGTFQIERNSPGQLRLALCGGRLAGIVTLTIQDELWTWRCDATDAKCQSPDGTAAAGAG